MNHFRVITHHMDINPSFNHIQTYKHQAKGKISNLITTKHVKMTKCMILVMSTRVHNRCESQLPVIIFYNKNHSTCIKNF